jgi:hypothetical protein
VNARINDIQVKAWTDYMHIRLSTSNGTELEKPKKCLQFPDVLLEMFCIDCLVSRDSTAFASDALHVHLNASRSISRYA